MAKSKNRSLTLFNSVLRWLKNNGSYDDGRYYQRGTFNRMVKNGMILF